MSIRAFVWYYPQELYLRIICDNYEDFAEWNILITTRLKQGFLYTKLSNILCESTSILWIIQCVSKDTYLKVYTFSNPPCINESPHDDHVYETLALDFLCT